MPNYTDTKVNDMIFNILTSDQYNTLRTGGQLNSNQLYFVTDDLQKTLTIQLNGGTTEGTNKFTYDGSATKSINITPASIGALSTTDAAAGASQWITARDFTIKDADNTNAGTATSVNGTTDVILHLPSAIKADLIGNASSATKVNSTLTIQLNGGTTETGSSPNKFVYDGSGTKTVNITPAGIGALGATETAVAAKKLANYYTSRPSNANITHESDGSMVTFKASSTMTSNKPASDGHITHWFWDNSGQYDAQLFISDGATPVMQFRTQNAGTWSDWKTVATVDGAIGTAAQVEHSLNIDNGISYDGSATVTVGNTVYYIEGSPSDTVGAWTGSHAALGALSGYYTGMTIAYKPKVAGTSNGTTLNINGLGARNIRINDSNVTTHIPAESVILLVYDGTYWKFANYDSNNAVNQYISSDNTEYPILTRYATSAVSAGSYHNSYARFASAVTLNPSTSTITATNFAGNASTATKVNNSLTIQLNGGTIETGSSPNKFVFDGSATKTINITPSAIGALAAGSGAVSAAKWTTARDFKIASSDGSNVGAAVSVDGSGNVTLKLASTIKATIDGNSSSADKVNSSLTIQLNGGTTETGDNPNKFVYDGSTTKTINITPASIGALALSGGTMTGDITFNNSNIGIKRIGRSVSWHKGRDSALVKTTSISGYGALASIKTTNGSWDIGAYDNSSYTDDLLFSYITDTLYNGSTASFTKQIKFLENGTIVADNFTGSLTGNATSANKVNSSLTIQFNGGTTETGSSPNKFVYDGSGTKTVNITPAAIGAVAKSGDTMTGFLTLHADPTNAMHAVTKQYADGLIAAADAMRYKGTISGGTTTPGTYTPAGSAGDTYRVDTAGYINGEPVEVGDLIICNADSTAAATSSTYSTVKSKWNIIQVNVDNAVFRGDNVLASGAILIGDSTPGKVKNLTDAVGSNTRPIYLASPGVPTAITYTANRLYYSKSTTSYEAGTHYASATKIAINSTSEPVANLHINGTTSATDTITVTKGNTAQPKIAVSNGTHVVSLLVGSGGTNHGLYSDTATADWIIYRAGAGNVSVPNWKSIGSSTQPVCFDNTGRPLAISYTFGASIAAGTTNRIAYYTSDSAIGAASTHYISNTQIHIGATSAPGTGEALRVTGKAYFVNGVTLPSNTSVFQNQGDTSNYTTAIKWLKNSTGWYKEGTTLYTHQPSIGQHNTGGDGSGSIVILPYPTDTNPWGGTVGLYITKGSMKLDNNRIPHTGNTTGTVGSSSIGVYIDAGQIKAMSKSLSANVGPGTQYAVAYYDAADSITSITTAGTANQALVGQTSAAPKFINISPSQTWTNGTTAGPTLKITVLGVTSTATAIPVANGTTQSGVITTAAQTIGGVKTFSSDLVVSSATSSTSRSTGALRVAGGIAAVEQISGLRFQVDNHVLLTYNETTLSLDFIFS